MRLKTFIFFGVILVKLIAKRVFRGGTGEKFLRSQFEPEGLFTISNGFRKFYPEFSKCINCGFCEIYTDTQKTTEKPEFIFNSLTINLPDLRLQIPHPKTFENFECPAGAHYREIVNFIEMAS